MCSAFPEAAVSVIDNTVINLFPFLRSVTNTASFDDELKTYVSTQFVQMKYQQLLGCNGIDLTKTSDIYARFTTTVICNALIQNSRSVCGLSTTAARPICAETCAQQAESESIITANRELCPQLSPTADDQIRADFTNCALPANSLTSACISGATNEPNNCGFANSTVGLCQYCASGGINSTDTCCYNSDIQNKCANVVLPAITGFVTLPTSLPSPTSTQPKSSDKGSTSERGDSGLSSGVIAGITIGSILGTSMIIGLIFLLVLCVRRRPSATNSGIFNQPSASRFHYMSEDSKKRQSTSLAVSPVVTKSEGYEALPGGRIARMSALENCLSPTLKREANLFTPVSATSKKRNLINSSSDDSILSSTLGRVLRPPPAASRTGSLSNNVALAGDNFRSPNSDSVGDRSSPPGHTSLQSEQLLSFQDYYSTDEIHPGDKVATLWAYQPRAADEFALERGDMLKVAGIWDDGWATGVMIDERADEWDSKHNALRDSGVSETLENTHESPRIGSEIKAFPLVCVCLPEYWRKTIDGDGSTGAESN